MFIVIEGLDGVGKSTIAKALAEAIGAEVLSTPGKKFNDIREQLDSIYQDNHQARQLFYMSTVVSISEQVRELINKGKNVIVDRYWLSTQVYHQWKSENNHFELADVENKILIPDITLYLHLPLEQRKNRLSERKNNTLEDNLTLIKSADKELNNLYLQHGNTSVSGRWLSIKANVAVDDVVKNICVELDKS
ncbi:MAG: dTMP kinase [Cognaticolwellia sp.]